MRVQKGVEVMGIKLSIFARGSKKAPAYFDPKLIRDAELAREKAWHDAYLASHGIG